MEKRHSEEHYNVDLSNIICVVKSRIRRWAVHVAGMGDRRCV
jgi:hypothetical protein